MSFARIYPLLVAKAERKGRTQTEVDEIITWLTVYSQSESKKAADNEVRYGDFFQNAPMLNPNRKLIRGSICYVKVEGIGEPLMQEIRYLDKLVDELAKGKSVERIKRAVNQGVD